MAQLQTEMRKLWRGVVRTIFWSYERGSWPYDVMVVLIVLFVLVTPRSWFHDQPMNHGLASGDIVLVAENDATGAETFRVGVSFFPSPPTPATTGPELKQTTHDILSRKVKELKGKTFHVQRVVPVRGQDGSVECYEVDVTR